MDQIPVVNPLRHHTRNSISALAGVLYMHDVYVESIQAFKRLTHVTMINPYRIKDPHSSICHYQVSFRICNGTLLGSFISQLKHCVCVCKHIIHSYSTVLLVKWCFVVSQLVFGRSV